MSPNSNRESLTIRFFVKRTNSEHCCLTEDKDFGELAFRQRLVHHGVVLIRLSGLSNLTKAAIVAEALRDRGEELVNAFSVISPGLIRIRKQILFGATLKRYDL